MKNLKKVLALAVAFVMCFTMFAGAAVFSDVPVGGNYSEAITFLSDLQIIAGKPDGTFGVNDAITRADAACLIARMMTGQQNPPKYDNHVAFSDVPVGSYYEAAVGYCAALGVTSGTGGGKFSPMKTITDGEFVAMLTRALGYDTPENPLQFPMGNITVAQAKGLLDGVNIDYMSDALRGEDAQMLYNAVFADYDREAKNKNIYQSADDHYNVTIAEAVFDLGRYSYDSNWKSGDNADRVDFHGSYKQAAHKCTAHTWVIAGVDARYKENTYVAFAIDDDSEKPIEQLDNKNEIVNDWAYTTFTYDGDIDPLIGYRVELWGEMDHPGSEPAIVAVKALDGQTMTNWNPGIFDGESDGKVKMDGKTLMMDKNNEAYAANLNLATNLYDTRKTDKDEKPYYDRAYTLAEAKESVQDDCKLLREMYIAAADGDQYRFFDWDSDDNIDFVVRDTYKYGEVKSVSNKRVVLEAYNVHPTASEYSLKIGEKDLVVEGADGLAEGDIVEIAVTDRLYDTGESDEAVTITLSQIEAESKTLEKINLTKDIYTFDGEDLTLADECLFDVIEKDISLEDMRTKENVGQAFNIYFDRSGFMLKARVADDSARGYLMILDTADGNQNLNKNNKRYLAAIDVLFDDNTVQDEVPVVSNLTIRRASVSNEWKSSGNGYTKSNRSWDQRLVVGNVYKYYMNKDGEITRLDEQTVEQSTNYSYDESKERISIRLNDKDGAPDRNYTFTKDAVIFAARNNNGSNRDASNRGYVRTTKGADNIHDGDNTNAKRFYVDASDVVAVKVEDVPEIDNRRATTDTSAKNYAGWTTDNAWKESDVTHPSVFLNGDENQADSEIKTFINSGKESWMEKLDQGQAWAMSGTVNSKLDKTNTDGKAIPTIAYNFGTGSKDEEIAVAVLGVDTLDYFNQSSVKLALITDVNYHGNDVYSIEGAIDGQVANFKTIAADEDDLFVGRISSYNDMLSYLDQAQDNGKGNRAGLYAEVNMDSEGLITKVRAMDIVPENSGKWDNENIAKTEYAEGNVYRVIRGVVNDVRSASKYVNWQTNPVAYDEKDQVYTLSEYNNHNLYDTLEGTYDSDTKFYEITKRPNLSGMVNEKITIQTPFHKDLSSKLKTADENILEKSLFIDKNAVYYLADFAVRKSDADELVAVFAFTEELTNGKNKIDVINGLEKKNLTVTDVNKNGTSDIVPAKATITLNSMSYSDQNNTVIFRLTDKNGDTQDLRIKVDKDDNATRFLDKLADALENATEVGSATKIFGKVQTDGDVLSVEGLAGTTDAFKLEQTNLTDEYKITVKYTDGVAATTSNAKSTITVANSYYSFSRDQKITLAAKNNSKVDGLVLEIDKGDYQPEALAKAIKDAFDTAIAKVTLTATDTVVATVKGNVVTIEDSTVDANEKIELSLEVTYIAD